MVVSLLMVVSLATSARSNPVNRPEAIRGHLRSGGPAGSHAVGLNVHRSTATGGWSGRLAVTRIGVSANNKLVFAYAGLGLALLALSIPLHCLPRALPVALVCALCGSGLGLALAMVTRTRRPLAIYGYLLVAILTFAPLVVTWPPGDSFDVQRWGGAPEVLDNYFDFLRMGIFLVSIPFPFARFGQHAPDPLPSDKTGPDE